MFRIRINALWTKDFFAPLVRVLMNHLKCSKDEAYSIIRHVEGGEFYDLNISRLSEAESVACDLMEYGCYVQSDQIEAVSNDVLMADFADYFDEDMSALRIIYNKDGHVGKILEAQGYSFVIIEDQSLRDFVGELMLKNGAERIEPEGWEALKKRLDEEIEANEVRRMELRAKRAAEKQMRRQSGLQEEE